MISIQYYSTVGCIGVIPFTHGTFEKDRNGTKHPPAKTATSNAKNKGPTVVITPWVKSETIPLKKQSPREKFAPERWFSPRVSHTTMNPNEPADRESMYPSRWQVESLEIPSCKDIFLKAKSRRSLSPSPGLEPGEANEGLGHLASSKNVANAKDKLFAGTALSRSQSLKISSSLNSWQHRLSPVESKIQRHHQRRHTEDLMEPGVVHITGAPPEHVTSSSYHSCCSTGSKNQTFEEKRPNISSVQSKLSKLYLQPGTPDRHQLQDTCRPPPPLSPRSYSQQLPRYNASSSSAFRYENDAEHVVDLRSWENNSSSYSSFAFRHDGDYDKNLRLEEEEEDALIYSPSSATTTTEPASASSLGSPYERQRHPGAVYVRNAEGTHPPVSARRSVSISSPPYFSSDASVDHHSRHSPSVCSSCCSCSCEGRQVYQPPSPMRHVSASISSSVASAQPPPRVRTTKKMEIEVSPGVYLPLHGTDETLEAMRCGDLLACQCIICIEPLYCVDYAAYVLCPKCRVVSPSIDTYGTDLGTSCAKGVGLGMMAHEYHSWQMNNTHGRR